MIQVTLHANEFEYVGTYDNRNYTSLRIQRISNSRVYFFTIKNGMKMNTMAKKMQLDNGKVYVSFGKQGKLYIGTYIDTEATEKTPQETPSNELYQSSIKADKQNNIQKSNPTIQVTKQKESILIRGYMGKVEQVEAYKINHHELELYLYKSPKYYAIYEKNTGKSVIGTKPTKKEAINQLKQLLNNHYDKLKAAMQSTIEKDGCISNYKIGAWINGLNQLK